MTDFLELLPEHRREFQRLIAIYQEAIDPSEQKTPAELQSMAIDPRYTLLASVDDGMVNGFAIIFFANGADFWLLEYMAVAASARGRRLGEALFHESYRRAVERDRSAIMILEVDQPGSSTNAANDTQGRFRFYSRLQCRMVSGLNYHLPLETKHTPPSMMLLTYSVPSLEEVSKQRVERWLTTLYVQVYGRSSGDARIAQMLERLPDQIPLRPL